MVRLPRTGLTAERIVSEATGIVDREGPQALTLNRLADQLGVKTPSLYNHVDGLHDLQRRMTLATIDELAEVCRNAAMGKSGTQALRAIAVAYRQFALERPGTYLMIQAAAPHDEERVRADYRVLEPLLVTLTGLRVEGDDAIHVIRGIRSALHGFVVLEAEGGFGIDLSTEVSFTRLVDGLIAGLVPYDPEPER